MCALCVRTICALNPAASFNTLAYAYILFISECVATICWIPTAFETCLKLQPTYAGRAEVNTVT